MWDVKITREVCYWDSLVLALPSPEFWVVISYHFLRFRCWSLLVMFEPLLVHQVGILRDPLVQSLG